MRKKRQAESEEYRSGRAARRTQQRIDDASAEDKALDAAVKKSIRQHGP
jgi:hypothetical protein